jgi:tetratricopeptide (TPR) repeat protein
MVVDGRRDHSFRVPRPDLSVKLGTPNACNDCHKDRSAQWAADSTAKWYGPNRISGWHYAEAIHAGRNGSVEAESLLVRTIQDAKMSAMVRATALSLLQRYLSPASLYAVEISLRDSDPLVRRAAVAALSAVEPRTRVTLGFPMLHDPIRTVRLEAVSPLLDVPPAYFTTGQIAMLDQVIEEYRAVQRFNADRAESYLNLGAVDAQLGKFAEAENAYRTAIQKQASFMPAYINLADLYRQQGFENEAEQTLRQALKVDPHNGDAHYALGLSLVRQKRLRDAIPALAKAAQLRPDLPRYAYAHAVALHETKEIKRALEVLARAHKRHPADREVLTALVEYSREAGDHQAASSWAQKLADINSKLGIRNKEE